MIDYEKDRFWCDSCGQQFVLSEYIITVDDFGEDSHYCSWNCLTEFGTDGIDDDCKTREGSIRAQVEFTARLAKIINAADELKSDFGRIEP